MVKPQRLSLATSAVPCCRVAEIPGLRSLGVCLPWLPPAWSPASHTLLTACGPHLPRSAPVHALLRACCLQSKHAAQRALLRNGEQLSASCMVGVKPLDAAHRAAVEKAGAAGGSAGAGAPSFAVAFPKPQQQRPYTLDASAAGSGAVVPLASKGVTQRLKEFVLGW